MNIDDLKEHLTTWLDERIDAAVKSAVDEANKDLMADLDAKFKGVEDGLNGLGEGLNGLGETVGNVSKDVNGVANSLTGLAQSIIAIPQQIVGQIGNIFPHFP